ncbi:MAG: hypothetical protein STHCBS139747_007306 [Sporothrix thermara]
MALLAPTPWLQMPASTSLVGTAQTAPAPTTAPLPNMELMRRDGSRTLDGYEYLGCVLDRSSRFLTDLVMTYYRNVPELCCEMCYNINTSYLYCGVEDLIECYCGVDTAWPVVTLPETSCASSCPGSDESSCGGVWAIDLYTATALRLLVPERTTTSLPTPTMASVPGYRAAGCYSDGGVRIIDATAINMDRNSPQNCCDWCAVTNQSNHWCGVEDNVQCFCGVTTRSEALLASAADCSLPCPGDPNALCGGDGRINLYSATGVPNPSTALSSSAGDRTSAGGHGTSSSASSASGPTESLMPDHGSSGLSAGAIAGIVVGAVAVVFLAALWFLRRRVARLFTRAPIVSPPQPYEQQVFQAEAAKPMLVIRPTSEMLASSPPVELEAWQLPPQLPPQHYGHDGVNRAEREREEEEEDDADDDDDDDDAID